MAGEPLVTAVADEHEAAERAAEVLATALDAARTVRGTAHASLSGGSMGRVYERLGEKLSDWSDVHFWFSDERCVAPDHEESIFRLVRETLDAPGAEIHRAPADLGPDEGALAYARALDDVVLDVALLGMGPDGHTASLFPHHAVLSAQGLTAGVRDSPKPPPERVTLTLPFLNASGRILLVVTGAGKAEALARAIAGADEGTPASLLARDRLEIVADPAALGGAGA